MKRLSLFALPIVTAILLTAVIACGGSGSRQAPAPATLEEAVTAVRSADTPSQGAFAYSQVLSYLGLLNDPVSLSVPEEDRTNMAAFMGMLISQNNQSPDSVTYGTTVDSMNVSFGGSVTPAAAIAELNADLVAAQSGGDPVYRKDLRLIAAFDGTAITLDTHLAPATMVPFARWFVGHFASRPLPLVRETCLNACKRTFDNDTAIAAGRLQFLLGIIDRYLRIDPGYEILIRGTRARYLAEYDAAIAAARAQYQTCTNACHQQ